MPGPQVDKLVNRILEALPRVRDLDEAVAAICQELDTWNPGLSAMLAVEMAEAREIVNRQFEKVEILHSHSVLKVRPQWYFGSKPTDVHWPAVESFFRKKGWHDDDVKAIDRASDEVVSLLENPKQTKFSCRGMVVGYVQSGKTANMTAVIAKALDAGYDTIIVLAGLTNKLRYQTQLRMYEDLVCRHPLRWQVLTPNDPERDFRAPPQGGFLSHLDKAQLAVIKKNVSPLQELKEAIERTLPAVLERLRILIIDDECDQASVNSARGELDMTAINLRIRELLSLLPAATYVGYTATPFANVLINPYPQEGQALDDIYPRDFITALPRPERYFGTEKLFGRIPLDAGNPLPEDEGLDMIRLVPPEDEAKLQPASRDKEVFQPVMAPSLEMAIMYFLACCAVRVARGDADKHMTMLVHTSAFVSIHERMASLIQGWVEVNRKELVDRTSSLGKRLEGIYLGEINKLTDTFPDASRIDAPQVFEHLPSVLKDLEFPVENGSSKDRIDYTGKPRKYIVVGGSILARGLTLEGLMVSYFLRTANQYDTLLQMGRWFGYRPRYEDLPRIWMPQELKLRFRALARVEQEIRDDIDQYRIQKLTPMQIAVRIRAIPGMAITAATKMRAARRCAVSYWGTHRQTFRFAHANGDLLRGNWDAAAELVSRSDALGLRDHDARLGARKLWRGVPLSSIQRFLAVYKVHPTHADLGADMLGPFLSSGDSRLQVWNVGVVEPIEAKCSADVLGSAGKIKLVNRAPLDESGDADIKALMSKNDVLFDCVTSHPDDGWDGMKASRLNEVGQVPLLVLYAIDPRSEPQRATKSRAKLNACYEIIGYGMVFPGSVTEGGQFVSVDLQALSADEIDEIAAEEAAQAEAAGV